MSLRVSIYEENVVSGSSTTPIKRTFPHKAAGYHIVFLVVTPDSECCAKFIYWVKLTLACDLDIPSLLVNNAKW